MFYMWSLSYIDSYVVTLILIHNRCWNLHALTAMLIILKKFCNSWCFLKKTNQYQIQHCLCNMHRISHNRSYQNLGLEMKFFKEKKCHFNPFMISRIRFPTKFWSWKYYSVQTCTCIYYFEKKHGVICTVDY